MFFAAPFAGPTYTPDRCFRHIPVMANRVSCSLYSWTWFGFEVGWGSPCPSGSVAALSPGLPRAAGKGRPSGRRRAGKLPFLAREGSFSDGASVSGAARSRKRRFCFPRLQPGFSAVRPSPSQSFPLDTPSSLRVAPRRPCHSSRVRVHSPRTRVLQACRVSGAVQGTEDTQPGERRLPVGVGFRRGRQAASRKRSVSRLTADSRGSEETKRAQG